jgi:hypothetical protein
MKNTISLVDAIRILRNGWQVPPPVAGNAKVIAAWPASRAPRPIGLSFAGPKASYRVW